jgi:hypothetical protein
LLLPLRVVAVVVVAIVVGVRAVVVVVAAVVVVVGAVSGAGQGAQIAKLDLESAVEGFHGLNVGVDCSKLSRKRGVDLGEVGSGSAIGSSGGCKLV